MLMATCQFDNNLIRCFDQVALLCCTCSLLNFMINNSNFYFFYKKTNISYSVLDLFCLSRLDNARIYIQFRDHKNKSQYFIYNVVRERFDYHKFSFY